MLLVLVFLLAGCSGSQQGLGTSVAEVLAGPTRNLVASARSTPFDPTVTLARDDTTTQGAGRVPDPRLTS